PLLLGIVAGLGAATGELVGYTIGRGGRRFGIKTKKWDKKLNVAEKLFQKYGGFFAIIIIAATPIPDNVMGVFCGMIRYPMKKYFAASATGKIIMNIIIAYAGFFGINFVITLMGGPVLA
ncbi:MAG: VTT domain-containing protein, partial [Candidatus Aenigmarchaeota archaeon]|nr:VTT domain-containing protein [Candidatus Aenigmarchaeota archaeon]